MPLHRYEFSFNDETSREHDIYVETRPDIPIGKEDVEYVTVAGRESPVTLKSGNYDNIKIKVECGFKVSDPNEWALKVREISTWLDGSGKLSFGDSEGTFYKAKHIEIDKVEREGRKYGHFEVEFTCEPFEYLWSGQESMTASEAAYNPYSKCKPIYKITGSGTCTLTVNGGTMKCSVSSNVTIDTERMIAYKTDGTLVNTSVAGDYEYLWLEPGDNTIKVSSTSYTLTVIPNWRCM